MSLEKIFLKYKCDKAFHKYHLVYDIFFKKLKKKKINILEIGISDGASLKAWSEYFKKSKIIGFDIKKIDLKKKKLLKKNIFVHKGSQTDKGFINFLISKYNKFDIIIDDGSHKPSDVISSFKMLFDSLSLNGLYFIEDTQTSYNHYFGGNSFDLKYSNTHMNFFKHLTDSLNYKEIANPYYMKSKYDGLIKNISFFNNIIVVQKGLNNNESNLVLNNSFENKRFNTKVKRNGFKFRYFIIFKIILKIYTFFLFLFNFLKKIILFRY
jgi:23S rRNA U2552 (ribose-2'-O)-methylase RlmE/FtsJ